MRPSPGSLCSENLSFHLRRAQHPHLSKCIWKRFSFSPLQAVKKMMKEDSSGDIDFSTSWSGPFSLQRTAKLQKAGGFDGIKNKEQWREKHNIWLARVTLPRVRRKKEGGIEPGVSLALDAWLTGATAFLLSRTFTGTGSYLSFHGDAASQTGVASSWDWQAISTNP